MVGNPLASWLSERISDAEKGEAKAIESGDEAEIAHWTGVLCAFLEVEYYIANQESK